MCIISVTSNCQVLGPGDASADCEMANVYPPTAGTTCNITAIFGDGSQSNMSVQFTLLTSNDPCCPGDQYEIDPPGLLVSASQDAGID